MPSSTCTIAARVSSSALARWPPLSRDAASSAAAAVRSEPSASCILGCGSAPAELMALLPTTAASTAASANELIFHGLRIDTCSHEGGRPRWGYDTRLAV